MNNKQELVKWLQHALFITNEKIREVESRLHTKTTAVKKEYEQLQFRLEWLEFQINSLNK